MKPSLEQIACAICSRGAGYIDEDNINPRDVICRDCYEEMEEEEEEEKLSKKKRKNKK